MKTTEKPHVDAAGYTVEELMACVLSRELRNREMITVGTLSPIPAAAAWLAKASHAPDATVCVLGSEDWPFEGTKEFFDLVQRGGVDVFFLSGAQIDRHGNINLHVIGDYGAPRVRLPGGAGSAMVYYMAKRTLLFKTDHDRRGFVERVDFVTSAGPGQVGKRVHRPGRLGGVFTPLAVLRYSEETGTLRLDALMPGVTPEAVQERTGFDLGIRGPVPAVPPPSAEELALLRTTVRRKLMDVYPEFARQALMDP